MYILFQIIGAFIGSLLLFVLTENVPAYGHTVFTVRRDLLYGDYFIGMEESWSGMATHIQFGSDTFKTWDDIAAYFSRLGGQ